MGRSAGVSSWEQMGRHATMYASVVVRGQKSPFLANLNNEPWAAPGPHRQPLDTRPSILYPDADPTGAAPTNYNSFNNGEEDDCQIF